jgi:hypothetical protein
MKIYLVEVLQALRVMDTAGWVPVFGRRRSAQHIEAE